MADKKVTELSAITNLSGDDLLLVVNDPSGTPQSNKVTVTNLFANVVPNVVHKGTVTARGNTTFSGTTMTVTANLTIDGTNVLSAINDRLQVANAVTNTNFQLTLANTNSRLVALEFVSANTSTKSATLSNSIITFVRDDDSEFTLDVTAIQGEVSNSYLTSTFTTNAEFQTAIANTVSNTDFQSYVANTNLRFDTKVSNTTFQSALANTNSTISGLDATLVANSYFQAYFSNAELSSVGSITFDANEGVSSAERKMFWDVDAKTASLGLENDVVLQLGQEQHTLVRNQSGQTIENGVTLYTDGSVSVNGDEHKLTVQLYTGNGTIEPEKFVGLSTQDFNNGLVGYCTTFGYVRDIDTRGSVSNNITDGTETWSGGDILYAHPSVAGKLTNQQPVDALEVAIVVKVGQTDGIVFVRPVIPTPNLVHAKFTITANGTSGYCFAGSGAANTNNETLYLYKGMTYKFNNTTGASHPFQILNTAGGSAFSNGVSGSQTGVQYFTVPHAQQSNLVYQCSIHSGMQGTLAIVS